MKATTDLRNEHGAVARMLRIVDRMAVRAREGTAPDEKELAGVVDFLRVFVDKCHHGKEETVLFPAMRELHVEGVDYVIARLLEDHASGRSTVSAIAGAAERVAGGHLGALEELAIALDNYTELLRAHIRREEADCFDPADRQITGEAAERLQEGYDAIERDVVGGGVHEAFHELLDRLDDEYDLRATH